MGIHYLFVPENKINNSLAIEINNTPVKLSSTYWGSFEKVSSIGGTESKSFRKMALLGSHYEGEIPSIYLEDNQLPLVLVGNSRIEGEAFLSEKKVKPGSISGHYYNGEKLVYGKIKDSNSKLPGLEIEWRAYVKKMQDFIPDKDELLIDLDNLNNSFFKERRIIYQNEKIYLDKNIKGNVIIKSESAIEISRKAQLNQVLLIAPKIIIKGGFEGSLHIIAEEIKIDENVKLLYPSSLIVMTRPGVEIKNSDIIPEIEIGANSLFQGNLIFLKSSENEKINTNVLIGDKVLVEGNIYCEGYIELKGKVIGSLFTKYFVANEGGSKYINHIYNGKILTTGITPEYCGILFKGIKKKVALWLF